MERNSIHTTLTRQSVRIAIMLASVVIILAGIKAAASIVVPFLLAMFLAIVLNPVVNALMRFRLPRALAITLIILVIIAVITLLFGVLGASLNDFSRMLPQFRGLLFDKLRLLQDLAARFDIHFSADTLARNFDPGVLMNLATQLLSHLSGAMTNLFLLLMTVVFMLFEVQHIPYKLRNALADPDAGTVSIQQAVRGITQYLAIKTAISLLTGIVVWLMLAALGIRFSLMWGVFAFLLNYIPNIGSVIAAILPVIQALLFNGFYDGMLVATGFIIINMLLGNILEPRVMGRGLGISTLVVFLSLIFWGWLLGTVGMLLSVPLTSVAKILLELTPVGRRIAVLLGDGEPTPGRTH
ncbi:AI-2E family transporter [Affinibrenneria salicis]|uniref:AI-2E family transporter n=1 Tax=Affinibrenneria salicis TaxID=2590031 RepID=A0A5J5FXI0_9GAMM|nr:AI-2E family transporter [Affinibrenneria salicis]KAA8998535.1 AI-2E family transporter [Affinibrenneria salicis]